MDLKTKGALLVCAFMLTACGEDVRYKKVFLCDSTTEDARSKFILDCIKNGNPNSDEEPEDWIPICENISKELHCSKGFERITFVGLRVTGKEIVSNWGD